MFGEVNSMRKAKSVANYVIAYGMKIGHPVSNLQLQKILYYIQVYFLKKKGVPFFKDEIEAWQFGPVIPTVYYQYAAFGPAPITMFKTPKIDLEQEEKIELEQIVREKTVLSLWDTLADIHKKGKAWDMYYKVNERNVIPKKAMELYG